MQLLLSLDDGIYRWTPPGTWELTEARESWRGQPVLFRGLVYWRTDTAITHDDVRCFPFDAKPLTNPFPYQNVLLWLCEGPALAVFDGTKVDKHAFPLPKDYAGVAMTRIDAAGDRLVAYGPGVKIAFDFDTNAKRAFTRPSRVPDLVSMADVHEETCGQIAAFDGKVFRLRPGIFSGPDGAVEFADAPAPYRLLADPSEGLLHAFFGESETWHMVFDSRCRLVQPLTYVAACPPTDAILHGENTPTVEIPERPRYDVGTKCVLVPFTLMSAQWRDNIGVRVEFNDGTGWRVATANADHPAHSGITQLETGVPYTFAHAIRNDLPTTHVSVQYNITAIFP